MTGLHIFTADKRSRTRRHCPVHKRLCYGTRSDYYDTVIVSFDCGTLVNYGYGYYEPPKKYKRLKIYQAEDGDYEILNRYAHILFKHKNRKTVERMARERLKNGGIISYSLALQSEGK